MGRRPKPLELHEIEGTKRPDRHNRRAPKFEAGSTIPAPPTWMSRKAAVAEWYRMGPDLHALGLLTKADLPVFAVYCNAVAEYEELTAALAREGWTTANSGGGDTQNPLAIVRAKVWSTLADCLSRFGFSPADRARITAKDAGDGEGKKDDGSTGGLGAKPPASFKLAGA